MKYQVRIHKVFNTDKSVKALASVTVEDKIAIHGVRIIETDKGRFVAMPFTTFKDKDGKDIRRDVAHPISTEARKELEDAVFEAYEAALKDTGETNE